MHAQAFCRSGCPTSTRPGVWFTLLCETPTSYVCHFDQVRDFAALQHFLFSCMFNTYTRTPQRNQLLQDVQRYDMITDRLLLAEAASVCDFDDNYFVFSVSCGQKNMQLLLF